ncbi:universal stress protein [Streptomyces sp. NBC_00063]|uniref:universal stress protein n=1 Tax=Streptomyces sp. NBC_00063 TaxID=2975638 RepID=UPI0022557612|nr:universal stress protein [Streptomyces sp. NBC_00063]MCX5435319.1 universal stress protein [Streptomyces sp. NBC_00063]
MNGFIAVGLDGSEESLAAAHWAAREALLHGVPLRLVHSEQWSTTRDITPITSAEMRSRWAETLLHDAADALHGRHPELGISTQSLDDLPARALASVATTADMLVLGSRGRGALTGFVLGSVGMAVLHSIERPVVLVRAGEDAIPHSRYHHADRELVVGVDTSRPCDALLAFAFEEAARRSCTLRALHCWTLPPLVGYGAAYDPRLHAQLEMSAKAGLDEMLEPWREKYPEVHVTARATVGHAAWQLVDAGAEAGLVVVGRRIRRSSVGARIGPITHAVLHHTRAPVAVVAHQ